MRHSRLVSILAATVFMSGLPASAQDLLPTGDAAPMRSVKLLEPAADRAWDRRTFYGQVAARETAALSFEVGGRLVEMSAREGVGVRAGEVIAQLDAEPFERAVERAELALEQVERDAARARTLAERNVAADVAADDAATARDLADVALRDAREALSDAVLTAPFDGIVAQRLAELFINVEPGRPVVALHDMSQVRVEIEMPERVLLRAGGIHRIEFAGTLPSAAAVPLELLEFEAVAGRIGQSFNIALEVPRDRADGLIPGASMTVEARLPIRDAGTVLPPAVILDGTERGFEVMVFRPEGDGTVGTVAPMEVEVASPDGITLTVAGLPEGARIVAAGGHLLEPGERVRVYDGLIVEER